MRRLAFSMMFLGLVPALALTACSSGTDTTEDPVGQKEGEDDGKVVGGKADAWNSTNNPSRFRVSFNYKFADLKNYATGRAEQVPWPSDYWSYYEDSINVRYHGANELSPAEKYDKAFNGWTPDMSQTPMGVHSDCTDGLISDKHDGYYNQLGPAAKWQHQNKGNYRARNGYDDDGDGKVDECGEDYDGIETWWGLCHAWVPAAILEPEPQHPVTMNGVEFTVSDIKAIVIAQHDRNNSYMLGGRCNEKEVARDEHGRLTQDECRDTNAGAFHVVITNMLGINKRSFAEDRTGSYQVWNQPVLGYQILESRELTEEEAVSQLGRPGEPYASTFNSPEAVAWHYVRMDVDYITESSNTTEGPLVPNIDRYTRTDHYEYIVELKSDGDVVGGEWLNYSRESHPDFLWLPVRRYSGNPNISWEKVEQLIELSRATDPPPDPGEVKEYGGAIELDIPDNDPNGVEYNLTVEDDIAIGALKVELDVEHTWIGDLRIVLEKDGVQVPLHNRTGGGADDISETYPCSEFAGMSAKGTWRLLISDHAGRDIGKLTKFKLIVGDSGGGPGPASLTFTSNELMSIPDNTSTGITSVLSVPDPGTIDSAEVKVNLTHTYIGDLEISVHHGSFNQVIHSREGGSSDDIDRTYRLTGFDGASLAGDWTLKVTDNAGLDVGTLNTWSVNVTLRQ